MTPFDPVADPPKEAFHPSADPDIFFEIEAVTAARGRLIEALETGAPPLAVLTGPPGIGKTTLLRRLARALEGAGWNTVIEGLPLGLEDLRERLPGAEPGRRALVGLDEAQALSRDLFVALDPLLSERPDLAILLVGHPSLEVKLDGLRPGDAAIRECVRCRLVPLDAAGVGAYIDHRWRTVRLGAPPFAPEAVERIAAMSDGVPQMINLTCSLALRLADLRGLDRVTGELVDAATAELPRPEPRHRVGLRGRPTPAPSARMMRSAMAAAVVIPPLLVGGVLLLRHAAHGPERRDPPPAASALRPTSEPLRVAALVPEPASIEFTSDADPERRRQAASAEAPVPQSTVAPVPPPVVASVPPRAMAPVPQSTVAPVPPPVVASVPPRAMAPVPQSTVAPVPPPAVKPVPSSAVATAPTSLPAAPEPRAVEPPASPRRSSDGKARREPTPAKVVAAAPPTLPSLPPRAASIPSVMPVAVRAPGKDEALLRRAEYGDLSAVQALLVEGASPEARDHAGFTPLMLAVIHGHPAIVQALASAGARVNAQNQAGLTPAMLAAINNRAAVLRMLIDRGADINARTRAGWTALTYAAWRGHAEIVRMLLARGADPNVTDREGWTILQYASWRATDPIVNEDLPGAPAEMAGRSTAPGPGHAEVVSLLKQARVRH